MKKDYTRLIVSIFCSFLGLALLILINCGGGGGSSASSGDVIKMQDLTPDNYGSIMSVQTVYADSIATKEKISVEEYWTMERISEAVKHPINLKAPLDMKLDISPLDKATQQIPEGVPGSFPSYNPDAGKDKELINEKLNYQADPPWVSQASSNCQASSYQVNLTQGYQHYPEKTIGILLVKTKEGHAICSASLIGKNMILTAAHCVSSESDGSWYTDFAFAPGYSSGANQTPYGLFRATRILVYSGWVNNRYLPADYAILSLDHEIGNTLGWLSFLFNYAPTGLTWDQWGYPGPPVGDATLSTLMMNRSAYGGYYCGESYCLMGTGFGLAPGASGGPWILWLNNIAYANSVVSFGDISVCHGAYSPYFDTHAGDLYKAAQSLQ